jgi:hypothetical protein
MKDIRILIEGTCEDAEEAFNNYLSEFPNSELHNMRCCTFTILPAHWKKFQEAKSDVNAVMISYLDQKNVNGMFVIEYTKRGVPHLHGISPNVHERCNRFWGASCKIKRINQNGIAGWITYCCKDKISAEMNKMFLPQAQNPELCIYTYRDHHAKFFSNTLVYKKNGIP